jgi:alpha-glucosidase
MQSTAASAKPDSTELNNADISKQVDQDWWRGAVIYQIYPRSYQDSTGNGMGDISGITHRLNYIAELGVDAVWISPFFKSPMKDFGYDVSDYKDIDPTFGSLADFDAMIAKAHSLNLKVMIDLVLSHSSNQHPWFVESRQSTDNDKADWYVWADPKADGTPPNNWLSIFGGSAWEWDGRRRQYYLHNFLASQPDLNFHTPAVQDALLDVAKFWLDRGVDGFRLDTINFYIHDVEFRDNPPLPKEQRNSTIAPEVNPYNFQEHLYSKNQPENLVFLERLRALMDRYPATAAVGEVGDAQLGLQIAAEYTKGDNRMHMCYAFEFLTSPKPTAKHIAEVLQKEQAINQDGWTCWALSNHDVVRHGSRWSWDETGFNADLYKLHMTIQLSFRGSVCLYQGEELGLEEADVPYERLQDPYGITFWPEFKGRDGCRTPMVWEATHSSGGFSSVPPWLPIGDTHLALAVDQQIEDQTSILSFYRKFIHFRKQYMALTKGDISDIKATENILSFTRSYDDEKIFCAFNLEDSIQSMSVEAQNHEVIFTEQWGKSIESEVMGNSLNLAPYQLYIARVRTNKTL